MIVEFPSHTAKPVLSGLSHKTKIGFQDRLSLNEGQTYCRMLQREHPAILSTFIMLPFVIEISALSIFERPLKTGFTVFTFQTYLLNKPLTTMYSSHLYKLK